LNVYTINAQPSSGIISLSQGSTWVFCSKIPTTRLNVHNGLTPTANFGFILTKSFVPIPAGCVNGIVTHILTATEILEDLGDNTNFVFEDQLSCATECVEHCDGSTTTFQNNNWCLMVSSPPTSSTLFYVTVTYKDQDPPPPSSSQPQLNGNGKNWTHESTKRQIIMQNMVWNTLVLLLFAMIVVIKGDTHIGTIVLLPLSSWFMCSSVPTSALKYLVVVSEEPLQDTANFGYFLSNHPFYFSAEPCFTGILANAMPAINLVEDIGVNTTFLSWKSISCYDECVSTCQKTDNGLNFTSWCLLVSNTKTTTDYANVTITFDPPPAYTTLPPAVPENSANKEIILSAWVVFAFGLAGIIGGLGLVVL
ncbi:11347_t:CDS:2, partial [Paraglomus occultum]